MNQQYMYLIKEPGKTTAATGLLKKLHEVGGAGAIILLTPEEHHLAKDMVVVPIGPPGEPAKPKLPIPVSPLTDANKR